MLRCAKHPLYNGLRKGRKVSDCADCLAFYEHQKKAGVREKRKQKAKEVKTQTTTVESGGNDLTAVL